MLAAHKAEAFRRGHAKPSDFFASETGGPMHHRNIVRRGLEKAVAAAGLPHLRRHDLRHLAASVLIAEGAPPSYVAAALGHAIPAITLGIYAHVLAERAHAEETRQRMERPSVTCSADHSRGAGRTVDLATVHRLIRLRERLGGVFRRAASVQSA